MGLKVLAFEEVELLNEQLYAENENLKEGVLALSSEILGESAAILSILDQIDLVAPTDVPVLILGESGTGKELVAHAIHRKSPRSRKPLIKINCASVPSGLYESEFFGHVKGAFTGALKDRMGRFELADGGTLLLDEVGDIPLELQGKLLRVLQDGQFERVGGQRTLRVDTRLLAATNRDLERDVEEGRFRTDLFYRLNVYPIQVPPLRERKKDIPLLVRHFLELEARRMKCLRPALPSHMLSRLQDYAWPGNVRELKNVVERALIDSRSGPLRLSLPEVTETLLTDFDRPNYRIVPEVELRHFEVMNMEKALEQCGGRIYGKDGAAALLGVRPTTLASRVRRVGIKGRKRRAKPTPT